MVEATVIYVHDDGQFGFIENEDEFEEWVFFHKEDPNLKHIDEDGVYPGSVVDVTAEQGQKCIYATHIQSTHN